MPRLIASVVTIAVVAIGFFVIKGAVKGTQKTVKDAVGSVTSSSGTSSASSDSTNYLEPGVFADQVKQLKDKEKSDAQLLQVTAADGAFTVKLRKASNDTAYGYESNAAGNMEPVKVEVSGSGSLKPQAFPISQLNSSAAGTINKELKKTAGDKAELQSLTMQRNPVSGKLMWTVSYKTDTRTSLSYFAPPSGKPLSKNP